MQDKIGRGGVQARPTCDRLRRGLSHAAIAELDDVSPHSVQRYLDEFADGGLQRVRHLGWAGKHCELDDHQASLEDYFIIDPD
jgi:hypothetical protein